MMKEWLSPKTLKFTERHEAIAKGYRCGVGVKTLVYEYGLSRTWIYHILYCYGLSPRRRLTETTDPLNYHRLKRHLKRKELSNHQQTNHRAVPEPQADQLRLVEEV